MLAEPKEKEAINLLRFNTCLQTAAQSVSTSPGRSLVMDGKDGKESGNLLSRSPTVPHCDSDAAIDLPTGSLRLSRNLTEPLLSQDALVPKTSGPSLIIPEMIKSAYGLAREGEFFDSLKSENSETRKALEILRKRSADEELNGQPKNKYRRNNAGRRVRYQEKAGSVLEAGREARYCGLRDRRDTGRWHHEERTNASAGRSGGSRYSGSSYGNTEERDGSSRGGTYGNKVCSSPFSISSSQVKSNRLQRRHYSDLDHREQQTRSHNSSRYNGRRGDRYRGTTKEE